MKTDTLKRWTGQLIVACTVVSLAVPAGAKESTLKEAEVPAAVIAAVKKKYPSANLLKFERESEHGKSLYEVKLRDGSRQLEVKLTPEGTQIEEEEVIPESELPEPVRKSFAASPHAKAKIVKIERVVHSDKKDQPTFEIKLTEGGKSVELLYDSAGKLLVKE